MTKENKPDGDRHRDKRDQKSYDDTFNAGWNRKSKDEIVEEAIESLSNRLRGLKPSKAA